MRKAESRKPKADCWSASPRCAPAFRFPLSALRRPALTLIELLVVIVILTTLVGGVIPVLSPNNDTRKIREASRMLQTYIHMAQAEAARTGRSHGIAFQESAPDSGVALEVYRLEVPVAFPGFSSDSRVIVTEVPSTDPIYRYGSVSQGNGGTKFVARHNGAQLYDIDFVLAPASSGVFDPFPPRMVQIGDQIDVEGNVFLIVDDNDPNMHPNLIDSTINVEFLVPDTSNPPIPTRCILLNDSGQAIASNLKRYEIIRQPTNSPEPPMQLPAAIAIDMQGSVVEGSSTGGFPADNSLFITPPNTVGIMFSPSGSISSAFLNGTPLTNVSRIVLLLGRVENGGLTGGEWSMSTGDTDEQVSQKQEQINWLNLDSRWLSIAANSGRVVVTENAFISPTKMFADGLDPTLAEDQIEAAHEFAHEMRRGGGG